jgi:hypothetical protein
MSNVVVQWALNRTLDQALALLHDCIRAATVDDVQASAILAGEKFGATLAISPSTRKKVELAIDAQADLLAVKFLKAKIGYASDGALDMLRTSMAGVNFLALVAALLGTAENFDIAVALETMIEESRSKDSDKDSLPTAHQLSRLISAVEPKLLRVMFSEDILKWKHWWTRNDLIPFASRQKLRKDGSAFPSAQGLKYIVEAFRRVSRVGEENTVHIVASSCAPWVTAFTNWSLGISPKIMLGGGTIILNERTSPVILIYEEGTENRDNIQVQLFRSEDSFEEILHAKTSSMPGGSRAVGMVSKTVHANESLLALELERGTEETPALGYRAMKEALPYALDQVRNLCCLQVQSPIAGVNPFPDMKRVAKVAKQYLGFEDSFQLNQLPSGGLITDLPVVRSWTKEQKSFLETNPEDLFPTKLSQLTADILALSLFDGCLEDIMLWSVPSRFQRQNRGDKDWFDVTRDILTSGKPQTCTAEVILDWSLSMIRHEVSQELRASNWLGSSFKGQVAFPKLYELPAFPKDGFLELYCIQGVMMHDSTRNKKFHLVSSTKSGRTVRSFLALQQPVTRADNFFPTHKIRWQVDPLAESIDVAMGWTGNIDLLNPFHALQVLRKALFLESCPHEPDNPSPQPETDAYFQGPTDDVLTAFEPSNRTKIVVFPIRGNDRLRILALSSVAWRLKQESCKGNILLITQNACISCSLHYCRKLDCRYLLL